jgi:hypothetical protein
MGLAKLVLGLRGSIERVSYDFRLDMFYGVSYLASLPIFFPCACASFVYFTCSRNIRSISTIVHLSKEWILAPLFAPPSWLQHG